MSSASDGPFADPADPFTDPDGSDESLQGRNIAAAQPHEPSDPFADPAERQTALKYGALQEAGALRQQWIENRSTICPIPFSTVTFYDLRHWRIDENEESLPEEVHDKAIALGLPDDTTYRLTFMSRDTGESRGRGRGRKDSLEDCWVGRTGPGVIFMEVLFRQVDSDGPHSSQIAKAVYEKDFALSTLRYVFVIDVTNEETKRFAETQVYADASGSVRREMELRVWEYGSPEYQGWLGTRIGRTVAYLVLCAFERGTRRIQRVVTWYSEPVGRVPGGLQIRFDIEEVV